jgi:hypothetical protein
MGHRIVLDAVGKSTLLLLRIEPRFVGRLARNLVAEPIELSLLQMLAVQYKSQHGGMKLAGTKERQT